MSNSYPTAPNSTESHKNYQSENFSPSKYRTPATPQRKKISLLTKFYNTYIDFFSTNIKFAKIKFVDSIMTQVYTIGVTDTQNHKWLSDPWPDILLIRKLEFKWKLRNNSDRLIYKM